jgi:hypothetical protein
MLPLWRSALVRYRIDEFVDGPLRERNSRRPRIRLTQAWRSPIHRHRPLPTARTDLLDYLILNSFVLHDNAPTINLRRGNSGWICWLLYGFGHTADCNRPEL